MSDDTGKATGSNSSAIERVAIQLALLTTHLLVEVFFPSAAISGDAWGLAGLAAGMRFAQVALLGIWGVAGRTPFSIRVGVTALAFSILVRQHPGSRGTLVFLVPLVVLVTAAMAIGRMRGLRLMNVHQAERGETRPQFRLWQLLVGMAACAVVFAYWRYFVRAPEPLRPVDLGWIIGATVLAGVLCVHALLGAWTFLAVGNMGQRLFIHWATGMATPVLAWGLLSAFAGTPAPWDVLAVLACIAAGYVVTLDVSLAVVRFCGFRWTYSRAVSATDSTTA